MYVLSYTQLSAWNSALQCEHSPMRMRDFFLLSFQVSSSTVSPRGCRLVYNQLKTNPHELGVVKVRCVMCCLAGQLSQLCAPDRAVLMGQKTCLLMAAAASLEICRSSDHTEQQVDHTFIFT